MLVPGVPFRRMRLLALTLSPRGFMAFNENLDHFMLRPGAAPAVARYALWRVINALRAGKRWAASAGLGDAAALHRRTSCGVGCVRAEAQ